jgi:hypothetical protein
MSDEKVRSPPRTDAPELKHQVKPARNGEPFLTLGKLLFNIAEQSYHVCG